MSLPQLSHETSLRIGIDVRLREGTSGGVEQVALGLVHGLSAIADGSEEYVCFTLEGHDEWLRAAAGPNVSFVAVPGPRPRRGRRVRRFVADQSWLQRIPRLRVPEPPLEPALVGEQGCDVMHFVKQGAFRTSLPNIYLPHDLQHRHLPQNFSVRERARRERWYASFCRQASIVTVMTQSAKNDISSAYGVPSARVAVIGWPPQLALQQRPAVGEARQWAAAHGLPEAFALFPARTWRHKNHVTLVSALRRLRDDYAIELPVVFTGGETELAKQIRALAEKLEVASLLHWRGFVSRDELALLYAASCCVVYPSLFEGWGMPILEALWAGTPVVCSRGIGFEELAGDAALYFDPTSDRDIAAALAAIVHSGHHARVRARRGVRVAEKYDWAHVARCFRAQYRALAGRALSEDDVALLLSQDLAVDELTGEPNGA